MYSRLRNDFGSADFAVVVTVKSIQTLTDIGKEEILQANSIRTLDSNDIQSEFSLF